MYSIYIKSFTKQLLHCTGRSEKINEKMDNTCEGERAVMAVGLRFNGGD